MLKFTKTFDELETHSDSWLYVLKNFVTDKPLKLRKSIFNKLFMNKRQL